MEPPLPMMQPMSSLGTVISWVWWGAGGLTCPVSRARAAGLRMPPGKQAPAAAAGAPPAPILTGMPTLPPA